jgi:hypothetical protein
LYSLRNQKREATPRYVVGQEAERVESRTDGRLTVTTTRDAAKELKHTADIVTVPV